MKLQKKASIEIYKHSLLSYIVTNNVNGIKKFEMASSSFCTPENECMSFRIFYRKQLANIAELSRHV